MRRCQHGWAAREPLLDVLDKLRTSTLRELQPGSSRERIRIRTGVHGGLCADHPDMSITSCMHRSTHCGLDHLDDRDAVSFASVAQHSGTRGVARDDEHFHALVDEMIHHIEGIRAHLGDRTRSVWTAGSVTHVQQGFMGKQVENRPCHCQTADTAVEDANGCVRHSARVTECPPRTRTCYCLTTVTVAVSLRPRYSIRLRIVDPTKTDTAAFARSERLLLTGIRRPSADV